MPSNHVRTPAARWRRLAPMVAAASFVAGLVLAFPPFDWSWTILFFLTPFVGWAAGAPRWRTYLATAFGASWLAWFLVLIWLRHIYPPWGWVGLALLSGAVGMFPFLWLAAARWAVPRIIGTTSWCAFAGLMGLAGWWIVLDWIRTWLFTGFPWLPLAAAFWRQPQLLQMASWTGHWGVTFIILLFNFEMVLIFRHLDRWREFLPKRGGQHIAISLLFIAIFIGMGMALAMKDSNTELSRNEVMKVGIVQPWTPADLKWSPDERMKNWNTLRDLTLNFRGSDVDVVMWPEAAPPFPVAGPGMADGGKLMQQLVDELGKPLLFGAVAMAEPARGSSTSPGDYDGIFVLQPGKELGPAFYAKRHLVPFGEYVPLRDWLPFLGKVVPIGDTQPGRLDEPLTVPLADGRTFQAAPLVCYEDVFPNLARDAVKAGADFIVVVTNDAWYGEEGGALQHAAHSVLVAVETHRPVLRCGNDGWSGWIDATGVAHPLEQNGTTYFRGTGTVTMDFSSSGSSDETFYVRHGDWFVAVSALMTLAGLVSLRAKKASR